VLDQLYGPLCDAVLASSASAGHLRRLEASSLFVIPLDRRRQWYRYHALFREFLLGELSRTEPDVIVMLHQRTADWYEANGSPELALEHLLRTADWDSSVRLTAKLCLPTYMAGRLSTVQRWLAAIGDANIERYPPLAVLACWAGVLTGDTTRALRWAAVVDAASFDGEPASGAASFDSAPAQLRAGMCAAGPDSMVADATLAVGQEPAWSIWRGEALWLLGEAYLLAEHLDKARDALIERDPGEIALPQAGRLIAQRRGTTSDSDRPAR
jgi:LuxR family transcriptional regulator, maltose regulon positive regulatory protein